MNSGQMASPLESVAAELEDDGAIQGNENVGVRPSSLPLRQPFRPPTKVFKPLSSTGSNTGALSYVHSAAKASTTQYTPVGENSTNGTVALARRYAVVYRRIMNKKHNPYVDGILTLNGSSASLVNDEGKFVTKCATKLQLAQEGDHIDLQSYECEIQNAIDADSFNSGKLFMTGNICSTVTKPPMAATSTVTKPFVPPRSFAPLLVQPLGTASGLASSAAQPTAALGGVRVASQQAAPRPRHDPASMNALVVQAVGEGEPSGAGTGAPGARGAPALVPVVVDPFIAQHLRPHQREGVLFLWRCISGLAGTAGRGAILADDMGLGKTLQSIAVLWTALKQSGAGGDKPLAQKAVIVCPSSLVGNWTAELRKWLGLERLRPVCVTALGKEAEEQVRTFATTAPQVNAVLIISYEMVRKYAPILRGMGGPGSGSSARVGLLICDEGHRLKSSGGNKTIEALLAIPTDRRILLTGTPVQNNLEEFYAMANFVCPGVLGQLHVFKRQFAEVIAKGRDRDASADERLMGHARAQELKNVTHTFVLRRTSEVLNKYLPPKTESILMCSMSSLQEQLYRTVCAAYTGQGRCGTPFGKETDPTAALLALHVMGKICTHPDLVHSEGREAGAGEANPKRPRVGIPSAAGGPPANDADDEEELGETDSLSSTSSTAEEEAISAGTKRGALDKMRVILDSDEEDEEELSPPVATTMAGARPVWLDFTSQSTVLPGLSSLFPPAYTPALFSPTTPVSPSWVDQEGLPATIRGFITLSGKLQVLDTLLCSIRRSVPSDRVVIVSSMGTALDMIHGLCRAHGWNVLRLDGSTPASERTGLVNRFNERLQPNLPVTAAPFAFLLSARAGGVGLNLIGANRLVLFDANWNPAVDKQALARVWRDGQKQHTYIYRMLTAYSIEEKILQRQLLKEDVCGSMGEGGVAQGADSAQEERGPRFSRAELRALFTLGNGQPPPQVSVGGGGSGVASWRYGCETAEVLKSQPGRRGGDADGHASGRGVQDPGQGSTSSRTGGSSSIKDPWPAYDGPASVQGVDPVLYAALSALHREHSTPPAASGLATVSFVRTLLYNQAQCSATMPVPAAVASASPPRASPPVPSDCGTTSSSSTGIRRGVLEEDDDLL